MIQLVWLIPLFPLLGFLIIGLFGKNISKSVAGVIACTSVLASFIVSAGIFFQLVSGSATATTVPLFNWIYAGSFSAPFSFLIDPLSSIFLLIITGVGFLIHLYSVGYMHDDEGFSRYFSYLNLFIFFMLLLVLGSNYLILFVGWEGVGLCSYLLIGFWFKNNDYNNAAKKAFVMNRIGDFGFLLGIILIFITFGSISYAGVFGQAKLFTSGTTTITAITLLLFVGAMGKSAQIPLYTWLPDAMAGPTPVSALIHAATMVTAGIYMIARSNILYVLAPYSMTVVAVIGAVTAVFAASIALVQNDIKKILAYSTVSQLGYMFLGLGVGAFTGSVFHVMTHAFFKALLFLGAGSVIHAMGGEQDVRKMGGLKKHLPITAITFLIATLAISGIPPFAGFFSKDEILAHAFGSNIWYWILGYGGSLMTAFYMFRVYYLTFYGKFRGSEKQEHHLHESPSVMTIPLIILAVLSAIGGFVGIPESLGGTDIINKFLSPVFADATLKMMPDMMSNGTEQMLMGFTVVSLLAIIYFARNKYLVKQEVPVTEGHKLGFVHNLLYHKYFVDELYNNVITKPLDAISEQFDKTIEQRFIDKLVNGIGKLVVRLSDLFRKLQTGSIGFYIFAMVASIIFILFYKVL
ncbi:MAG TPA: NADH-quinone oxidoreductase subunit L [Bacteroidia bacterium]|nr:NADH-quinone oxidoreductase subunit L [Bacteroidia bacterium]